MKDTGELETGKRLIIAEAQKRFKKDVIRIEADLKTTPSKEKCLALEKSILFKILRKDIDIVNDCTDVKRTRYYRTGHLMWPLDQIRLIQHHYNNYLKGGKINFNGKSLTVTEALDEPVRECLKLKGEDGKPVFGEPKLTIEWPRAEAIIDAVRFFMLEQWLELLHSKDKQKRATQVTAAVIGLFCKLVLNSGLVQKNDRETAVKYCERICTKYQLQYTIKVAKALYHTGIDPADLRKLQSLIFPKVDEATKTAITEELNKKKTPIH